jgi:hypothetical protein
MEELDQTLFERVDELIDTHKDRELQSTVGLQATVDELVLRNQGLESAIREIALEVEKLRAAARTG